MLKHPSLQMTKSGWTYTDQGCELSAAVSLEVNGSPVRWQVETIKNESGTDPDCGVYSGFSGMMTDSGLSLTLFARHYVDGGYITLQLSIENCADSPIGLGKCTLFSGEIELVGGNPALLKQSGWVVDSDVRPLREDEPIPSKTFSLLTSRETKKSIVLSFLTFDRVTTLGETTLSGGKIHNELICDFEGFTLLPGTVQTSETLYISVESDPFVAANRWAERVAVHYKPRFAPAPSLGWIGGWTWRCGFTQELYEDLIIENITAIKEKLAGFGIENIWMSIANYKDMVPGNWLDYNRERFPHGWEWLFERICEKGMRPGFWIAPFWVPDKLSPTAERMKDCLLKKDGKLVNDPYKLGYGLSQTLPPEQRVTFNALDPSHPRAVEFLREVFTELYRLGVRYYMIDFLYIASGSTPGHYPYDEYANAGMVKGPEVYRNGLKAIREAAGEDTYLLSSTGTTLQHIGCVDAVRAGCDFGEGRPLYPEMWFYPATCRVEDYDLLKKVVWAFAAGFFTDRRFFYNDAFNVMTVDKPVPRSEAEIIVSLFALSSGPVMLGDDIATIDGERLAMVKKSLPQYSRSAVAADLFDTDYPDCPKVFALPVQTGWEEFTIVGLLNLDDAPLSLNYPLHNLGLAEGEHTLFDFWNCQYCGRISGSLKAEVPPHSIRVFRIAPLRDHPWLLSTDMHVLQGAVEIEQAEWNGQAGELTVTCRRPAGETGTLWLRIPKGWKPSDYKGLHTVKTSVDDCVLASCLVRFEFERLTQRFRFEKI